MWKGENSPKESHGCDELYNVQHVSCLTDSISMMIRARHLEIRLQIRSALSLQTSY